MTDSDDWRDDETQCPDPASVSPIAAQLNRAVGTVLGLVWIASLGLSAKIASVVQEQILNRPTNRA